MYSASPHARSATAELLTDDSVCGYLVASQILAWPARLSQLTWHFIPKSACSWQIKDNRRLQKALVNIFTKPTHLNFNPGLIGAMISRAVLLLALCINLLLLCAYTESKSTSFVITLPIKTQTNGDIQVQTPSTALPHKSGGHIDVRKRVGCC